MNLIEETRFIMNKYGIKQKNLGQNFLIDEYVINEIIKNAKISKEDFVIEIGPGIGTLTSKLLENAGKVIAIELDKNVLKILNDRFKLYNNFKLINEAIFQLKTCKIVANLPYYITTPIITKLLKEKLNLDSITVMVQKEVANRLTAIPGQSKETGAICYYIYYYSDAKILLNVPRTCFIPSPNVDSSVISLTPLKYPRFEINDEEFLFKVIKSVFSQKRKTLFNSLINNNICSSKEYAQEILKDLNLNLQIRPQELSLQDFINICKKIK